MDFRRVLRIITTTTATDNTIGRKSQYTDFFDISKVGDDESWTLSVTEFFEEEKIPNTERYCASINEIAGLFRDTSLSSCSE